MPGSSPSRPRSPRLSLASAASIAALSLLAALVLDLAGLLTPISNAVYDESLRQRSVPDYFADLVLVAATNDDLARSKTPSHCSRSFMADIFSVVIQHQPAVLGVDFFYSEPSDPEEDRRLAEALSASREVVAGFFFDAYAGPRPAREPSQEQLLRKSGDLLGADLMEGRWAILQNPVLPIDAIAREVDWLGNVGIPDGRDTILRRYPLVVRDGERFYPSLALQAVRRYLDLEWSAMRLDSRGLSLANIPGRGTIQIPLDSRGRMLIPFAENSESSLTAASLAEIAPDKFHLPAGASPAPALEPGELPGPPIKGRIVIVGRLTSGSDLHATPVKPTMSGLMIHATTIRAILEGDFIRDTGPLAGFLTALLACLLIVLAVSRFGARHGSLLALILLVTLPLASILLLKATGYWIDPALSLATGILASGGALLQLYTLSEIRRGELRSRFERHFGPVLADQLLRTPGITLDAGSRKEVTIFFSDLVGYTATTESLAPEETVAILNRYFEAMAEIAFRHGATINQIMGDGLMAIFNDPVDQPDHPIRAVAMALEMQSATTQLSKILVDEGLPELRIRIGLAKGYATVGLMGSSRVSTYTAIGSTTNLAARICELAGPGEIFVNERAHAATRDNFTFEDVGNQPIKGIADPVPLHRVTPSSEDKLEP